MAGNGSYIHKFTKELVDATKEISSFGDSLSAIVASRNGTLRNILAASDGSAASVSMRKRLRRIEFEERSSAIRDIIERSNRLFEADEFMKSHPGLYSSASEWIESRRRGDAQLRAHAASKAALDPSRWESAWKSKYGAGWNDIYGAELRDEIDAIASPDGLRRRMLERRWGPSGAGKILAAERMRIKGAADDYILSLSDSKADRERLRDSEGRSRWGKNWNRVKSAEDKRRRREADDYILSLSDSKADRERLRDSEGRSRWGENWNRVKSAEDEKRRREEKIRRSNEINSLAVAANTRALTLLAYGIGAIWKVSEFAVKHTEAQIQAGADVTRWENAVNTIGKDPSTLRSALAAQGFSTPDKQLSVIRKEFSWLAGLATGKGVDRIGKLARSGLDVSGITSETSVEDFYRIIGMQLSAMTGKARSRAIDALEWSDDEAAAAIDLYSRKAISDRQGIYTLDKKRRALMHKSRLDEIYTFRKQKHSWFTPPGIESRIMSVFAPVQAQQQAILDGIGRDSRKLEKARKIGQNVAYDPITADFNEFLEQQKGKRDADDARWHMRGGTSVTNDVGGIKIDLSIPITAGNANATEVYEILSGRMKDDVEEVVAAAINSACETMEFVQ